MHAKVENFSFNNSWDGIKNPQYDSQAIKKTIAKINAIRKEKKSFYKKKECGLYFMDKITQ